jgi:hypothetical protein
MEGPRRSPRLPAATGAGGETYVGDLRGSREEIRQTTKWLIAGAAAVGAIAVADLKLTSLPQWGGPLAVAVIGFVSALLGVGLILVQAANVLALGYAGFHELAILKMADSGGQVTSGKDERVAGAITRSELIRALDSEVPMLSGSIATDISDLWGKLNAPRLSDTPDSTPAEAVAEEPRAGPRALSDEERNRVASAASCTVDIANQRVTVAEFKRLKTTLIIGGGLVVIGVVLFATSPNIPTGRIAPAVERPTRVVIAVTGPEVFGSRCDAPILYGVALEGPWEAPTVVTAPAKKCMSRRVVVTSDVGNAIPAGRRALPCAAFGTLRRRISLCGPRNGPNSGESPLKSYKFDRGYPR